MRCPGCAYQLRGLPVSDAGCIRCPECGSAVPEASLRWRLHAVGLVHFGWLTATLLVPFVCLALLVIIAESADLSARAIVGISVAGVAAFVIASILSVREQTMASRVMLSALLMPSYLFASVLVCGALALVVGGVIAWFWGSPIG